MTCPPIAAYQIDEPEGKQACLARFRPGRIVCFRPVIFNVLHLGEHVGNPATHRRWWRQWRW